MRLYYTWLHTIQDEWGFIIVLATLLVWTILVVLVTRWITRYEVYRAEEERYPERAKALIALRNTEIKRLRREIKIKNDEIEALSERLVSAKAWALLLSHRFQAGANKIIELIEGIKS